MSTTRWTGTTGLILLCAAMFLSGALMNRLIAKRRPVPRPVPVPVAKTIEPQRQDAITQHLPAEFAPVNGLMMSASQLRNYAPEVFVELVAATRDRTELFLLVDDPADARLCLELLRKRGLGAEGLHFLPVPTDSMWIRDYGPIFLIHDDAPAQVVDASYSAFGSESKVGERWRDDEVPIIIANLLALEVMQMPIRLEWGNLLTNGSGNAITSTHSLALNKPRGYVASKFGQLMAKSLGLRTLSFLPPLDGEATRHVDMYVTLLGPNLAVVAEIDPARHPQNAALMSRAVEILSALETPQGTIEVARIPITNPAPRMFRSYNNVINVNGALLVPQFSDVDPAVEKQAFDTYRELLPDTDVIGIKADEIARALGVLHCVVIPIPREIDVTRLKEAAIGDL